MNIIKQLNKLIDKSPNNHLMPSNLISPLSTLIRFPTHPHTCYNHKQKQLINNFVERYHCQEWIELDDRIQFEENREYLKRYYDEGEFRNKIRVLGEYYRYHGLNSRVFIKGVGRLIENNIEEKREMEYQFVTKENNNNVIDGNIDGRNTEQYEKLIKDVSLSYDDFEVRPRKKSAMYCKDGEQPRKERGVKITKANGHQVSKSIHRVEPTMNKSSFLVFKPRNHPILKIKKQGNMQTQENRIKVDKQQKKQSGRKKQNIQKNQLAQKTANNSRVSQLSRSKSKVQLHVVSEKKLEIYCSNNNYGKALVVECQSAGKTVQGFQNSLVVKSLSKKEILGNNKNMNNIVENSGKGNSKYEEKGVNCHCSYKNLKPKTGHQYLLNGQSSPKYGEMFHEQENVRPGKKDVINSKASSSNIEVVPKKMFNRALELKKRKG